MTDTASTSVEVPELVQLIDGEISAPSVDLGIDLENPNTGAVISRQRATSDDDVERVAAAASAAYESGVWAGTPVGQRAAVLEAVADALDAEAMRIAALESIGTGAVIRTTGMLAAVINGGAFRLAAAQLREGALSTTLPGPTGHDAEIHRLPWGPALSLVPWNAPAPMAARSVRGQIDADGLDETTRSSQGGHDDTTIAEPSPRLRAALLGAAAAAVLLAIVALFISS